MRLSITTDAHGPQSLFFSSLRRLPREIAVDPAGRFRNSCKQRSDNATSYRIDAESGKADWSSCRKSSIAGVGTRSSPLWDASSAARSSKQRLKQLTLTRPFGSRKRKLNLGTGNTRARPVTSFECSDSTRAFHGNN
ncbi:beta-propeller fold lactonase family protein [Granulicella sibirica]|uniref:beta-propeller fold lactonase family protein n=1 Tax=Granulicella sibirica TaxID=2479048 RepID=UPI00100905FD